MVVLLEIDARGVAGEIRCLTGFNVLLDSCHIAMVNDYHGINAEYIANPELR